MVVAVVCGGGKCGNDVIPFFYVLLVRNTELQSAIANS
jgi:hypothetical protein